MTYRDKTYCASPNCENKCGRKMSDELKKKLYEDTWKNPESYANAIWYAYFCGEPTEGIEHD